LNKSETEPLCENDNSKTRFSHHWCDDFSETRGFSRNAAGRDDARLMATQWKLAEYDSELSAGAT
jgi:hypothetical protein